MLRIAISVFLSHPRGEPDKPGPPRLWGNRLVALADPSYRRARRDHAVAHAATERCVDRLHRRFVLGGERRRPGRMRVGDHLELVAMLPDRLPARARIGQQCGRPDVGPQDRVAAADQHAHLAHRHSHLVMFRASVSIASRTTEGIASSVSTRYSPPWPRHTPGSMTCSVSASTIDITRVPSTSYATSSRAPRSSRR